MNKEELQYKKYELLMTQLNLHELMLNTSNYLLESIQTYSKTQYEYVVYNFTSFPSPVYVWFLIFLMSEIFINVYDQRKKSS